ncbi:MAG: hypothetical protein LBS59_07000 [Puniceicoccales bacterium]|nr:hypothetical protein [Puniceicoccales bacterium]
MKTLSPTLNKCSPQPPLFRCVKSCLNKNNSRFATAANSSVKNAIRPCALGRKNYLFIGAPEASQRAAILYTLIASARRRGHNPQKLVWHNEGVALR